jgi:hypothetical protein
MSQYRASWNAKPNNFNNGHSDFKFQAASDADANTIIGVVTAALSAQLTNISKYLTTYANYGHVHTLGTDKTVGFLMETDAGATSTFRLRNVRHAAVIGDFITAFTTDATHKSGDAWTLGSGAIRTLKRGETEVAQEP